VSRDDLTWIACGAVALVLIGMVLFGGGGSKKDGGPSGAPASSSTPTPAVGAAPAPADQAAIEEMLTRGFTESDPKQCTQDMTPSLLRQTYGREKGTLDRCRRGNTPQSEADAKSVEVESVMATSDGATAMVKVTSDNSLDGSVLTLRLVRQGGRWKLDRLADIQIDRVRLDQHVREHLGARGYLPAETSCAIDKFDRTVSDQDIERDAIVGGPGSSASSIQAEAASCLSRPTLLRELSAGFTAGLSGRGVPAPITRCVVDHLTHGVPTSRLRHLLEAGSRGADGWYRLSYEAFEACVGHSSGAGQSNTV
jgi:hypothetical protein